MKVFSDVSGEVKGGYCGLNWKGEGKHTARPVGEGGRSQSWPSLLSYFKEFGFQGKVTGRH